MLISYRTVLINQPRHTSSASRHQLRQLADGQHVALHAGTSCAFTAIWNLDTTYWLFDDLYQTLSYFHSLTCCFSWKIIWLLWFTLRLKFIWTQAQHQAIQQNQNSMIVVYAYYSSRTIVCDLWCQVTRYQLSLEIMRTMSTMALIECIR